MCGRDNRRRFKLGDWAYYRHGLRDVAVQIVNDGDPIAWKDRRSYLVRMSVEYSDPWFISVPREWLEPLELPSHDQVRAYLRDGGLYQALRANTYRSSQPERVWLTYSPRDGVNFTMIPDRGFVGGAVAPVGTLKDGKVRADRVAEVLAFLASFGLSPDEARAVLDALGTVAA